MNEVKGTAMRCPRCNGEMDQGRVSASQDLHYLSNRQTGMVRSPTPVRVARACLTCGYVELYLDASELVKKLK